MDEFQMIATMLDEPPAPDAQARGRARLVNGMREPEPAARRAWRRPALWSGFGLAATAAAAAGVVTLGSGSVSPTSDPAAAQPVSAKSVLLAAAEHAEGASASGKYWHVRKLQTRAFHVREKGQDYWMVRREVSEQWAMPDGRTWIGVRGLASVPMTAKDKAAWKKDGSRDKLRLAPRLDKDPGIDAFWVCGKGMSFKQVQALPADPGALKRTLTRAIPHEDPASGRLSSDQVLQGCLTDLLSYLPAKPKVRAAAYRTLAAMPEVTTGGKVTDERGREGVELRTKSRGGTADTVIIDPDSSLVLATSHTVPGIPGKAGGHLYLEAGWSDSGPKVPDLP